MNPLTLWELIFEPQFQAGFLAGLVAVAVGLSLRRVSPDWGVLWAAAAVAAVGVAGMLNPRSLGRLGEVFAWTTVLALLSVAAAATGIRLGRDRPGLPLAVGLTVGGVWATVPDTEIIGVLMGVTAAVLWLWWPEPRLRVGAVGAVMVPLLITAAALWGGAARASGVVGALGVIGALLIYAVGRPTTALVDVGIQALVVLGWSRWAGLSESALSAVSLGVLVTILGVVAKLAAPRVGGLRSSQAPPGE